MNKTKKIINKKTITHPKKTIPSKSKLKVGIIGLGIMGSAMAKNLINADFDVYGFDPVSKAQKNFKAAGGIVCKSTLEVAMNVDLMISSLPNPTALMNAALEISSSGKKGLIIAETSTLDLTDKKQARDILAQHKIILLDCPLSGTGAQAKTKDVSIYSSGPASAVKKMTHIFEGFSKANYYLGTFGNGMKMKLMANLLVAIHNVSTAEALLFGKNSGIDPKLAVRVLADGAGGSRMLQVRGPLMTNQGWKEPTMKVSVWQKDMKLIHDALAFSKTPAPLFAATQSIYNAAMASGHAEHDTAAVYEVLKRMSSPA